MVKKENLLFHIHFNQLGDNKIYQIIKHKSTTLPILSMFTYQKNTTKRFIVSLDKPPKSRWLHVLNDPELRPCILSLMQNLSNLFADKDDPPPLPFKSREDFFTQLTNNLHVQLGKLGANEFIEEMKGIALNLKVPIWDVALLHLLYEAEGGGCTSIVLSSSSSSSEVLSAPLLGRVLDWDFAELLTPLTIEVVFQKQGKIVMEGLTFAGYIGLLTAKRPNVCAVAIHYRNEDLNVQDIPPPSVESPAWPVALLVRYVLQAPGLESFEEVVVLMQDMPLWAPCYIVLTGMTNEQVVVLSRETLKCNGFRKMNKNETILIQTNVNGEEDTGNNFMNSMDREQVVRTYFANVNVNQNQSNRNKVEHLWKAMSLFPVLDVATVHACVFSACDDVCKMSSGIKVIDQEERQKARTKEVNGLWNGGVVGVVVVCIVVALFIKYG